MSDDPGARAQPGSAPDEAPAGSTPGVAPGSAPANLPPDPDAYDSPRAVQARARGLAAPYIPGGEDPDMDRARRDERRYLRILIAMVVVVVLSGFVLGILANLLGF
jgi:hypothetical protein